jgi:hypothetical protein
MHPSRLKRSIVFALFSSAVVLCPLVLAACGGTKSGSDVGTGHGSTTTVATSGTVTTVSSTIPKPPPTSTTRPKPPVSKKPPTTTTAPCSAGFECGHATAIGDSVMLDCEPDLQRDIPGIDVNAQVSRQWADGIALVQDLKAERALGSIVIIDLGTNGPVGLQQFQQMMEALSGASVVVFVTVHLPPSYSWYQSVNEALEDGVPMYKNARLANFDALADQNPGWFGSDGVHMPIGGTGAQAMAALITSKI